MKLALRTFVTLILVSSAARAECRNVGPDVVCDKPSFDTLVSKCLDFDKSAKVCSVKLTAAETTVSETDAALKACLAKPPPEPVVIKPSALSKVGPVVLSIVGSGVLGVTAMMDGATTGRAVGAVVGFLSVGAGLYWAIP